MASKTSQGSRHLLRQCSSLLNRHHSQSSAAAAAAATTTSIAHQTSRSSAASIFSSSEASRRLLTTKTRTTTTRTPHHATAAFHTSPANRHAAGHRPRGLDGGVSESEGMIPEAPRGPSDISALDVLGNTPVPSTSIDVCMSDGFLLNSGAKTLDGSGVLLIGGEAFGWRPWRLNGDGKEEKKEDMRLLNAKGQWHVNPGALGLLEVLWPRPDLLILGLGPEIRPISPELKKYISSLGLRVEILDTRNAASQYNLLATERGVNDVIAAMIPIGWREGVGAVW